MIPRVAEGRLADYCDVFCDEGAFTPEEATVILEAGTRAGLTPRIHADELAASGGSLVAAAVGARSADHLVFVDERGADALAKANVCAVLLPTASLYLKLGRFAPARMLIERGVPVALATDVNPGGGYSPSMPFAMTLACFEMGMTLEEALIASTVNAAWSLDCADTAGSLEPGKQMDAVIVRGGLAELVRVGVPAIRTVIKRGSAVVHGRHNETSCPKHTRPYSEFALIDLLDAFASNAPVPGGGSAAALAGALGVSLLIMAASLPKSRTGAPEEAADLAEAAARLRPLRDTLVALIDDDSNAYQAVMNAMKLPKGSPDEKAARTDALQSALKEATDVPLDVMRAGQQALAGGVIVARNAYRVAASDVAMGIELLGASVRGAALSIDGNLLGDQGRGVHRAGGRRTGAAGRRQRARRGQALEAVSGAPRISSLIE